MEYLLGIVLLVSNPEKHLCGLLIDARHQQNLLASFSNIVLVDANGIRPQDTTPKGIP
jgi:hypothetical protein